MSINKLMCKYFSEHGTHQRVTVGSLLCTIVDIVVGICFLIAVVFVGVLFLVGVPYLAYTEHDFVCIIMTVFEYCLIVGYLVLIMWNGIKDKTLIECSLKKEDEDNESN